MMNEGMPSHPCLLGISRKELKLQKHRVEPPKVNVVAMDQRTIFTWGYRKQTQDTLLAIMEARQGLLVDVRFMPFGRSQFAQYRLKASLGDDQLTLDE